MLLENTAEATARRSRYWTIVRQGPCRTQVFTLDPDGRGEALAVFGFEEEAELFLGLEEMGAGWRARETTTGELISVLYGPCADVTRVVLDPLPRRIAVGAAVQPLSIRSATFTRTMMDASNPVPALAGLHA